MSWITIPNWHRFQHYGLARPPVWIKNYPALLRKDEYADLTLAQRGLLHGIWLAYAANLGRIRTNDLAAELHARVTQKNLEPLNHAGLIAFCASRPLLLNTKNTESTEPTNTQQSADGLQAKRRRAAEAWIRNGAAREVPTSHLADVLEDEFKIGDPELVQQLVAQAQEWRTTRNTDIPF